MSETLLKTPLHEWHSANGGRMVDFAGWEMPVQYASIVDEHHAVRKAVGLFDISHMGRIYFGGPDAAKFLDAMLSRKVIGMKPGQIRYGLVCKEDGGILDDVLVYEMSEAGETGVTHQLVVNASNREKIVAWLTSHQSDFEVTIDDQTQKTAMIAVQGPKALEGMAALINVDIPAMKYYTGQPANVAGTPCYVSRTGYTGEDGCELTVAAASGQQVWDVVLGACQALGAKACGLGARDTLRLESAMPLYGHELSESINPVEAGLGFGYNLKDRTFIGSEAIAKFEEQSSHPVRVGLVLEGKRAAREGAKVLFQGKEVGTVTSGTYSPTLEVPIAMAYVAGAASELGTEVVVDIRGKEHPAEVVSLPFYKRA